MLNKKQMKKQTEKKKQILSLYKNGFTGAKIGLKFGITATQVYEIINSSLTTEEKKKARQKRIRENSRYCNGRSKEELMMLIKEFKLDREVAKKLGVSRQRVQQMRKQWAIPRKGIDNTQRDKRIVSLCKKGLSGVVIAEKTGTEPQVVQRILREAGESLFERNRIKCIERDREIVKLYKSGMSGYAIIKKLGEGSQVVYKAINDAGVKRLKTKKR